MTEADRQRLTAALERIAEQSSAVLQWQATASATLDHVRESVARVESSAAALEERVRALETQATHSSALVVGLTRGAWLTAGAAVAWLVQRALS